jgi:hypothetical protein
MTRQRFVRTTAVMACGACLLLAGCSTPAPASTATSTPEHSSSSTAGLSRTPSPSPTPDGSNAPQSVAIVKVSEGPFPHPIFDTTTLYQGPAVFRGQPSWLDVYAGGPNDDPANPGKVSTGGVWVFRMGNAGDYAHEKSVGTFLARKGSGEVTIVAVHGPVLTLRTSRNQTEWLDLRTLTYRYA